MDGVAVQPDGKVVVAGFSSAHGPDNDLALARYRLADGERPFRDLDEWLRRRLRQLGWKESEAPQDPVAQPARSAPTSGKPANRRSAARAAGASPAAGS